VTTSTAVAADEPGRLCGVEYPRPANVPPNTRIVRCTLRRGHEGAHCEKETGSTWPGCTCDLIDIRRFADQPEYVRGDPTGCPLHEPRARIDLRAEARHRARYGSAQPAPNDELRRQVQAVRELHLPDIQRNRRVCSTCYAGDFDDYDRADAAAWPCPTIQALDGEQ